MPSHSKVSPEELDALFPQYEVSPQKMSQVEKRIRTRCLLVAAFWTLRIFLAVYFPEFILVTREENPLLSVDSMEGLLLIRIVLLAIGTPIYLWSFFTNYYFRTANVVALVVVCCLIWSDMEVYVISSVNDLALPSLAMIAFRFIPLTLLFLNYLDIRK
tara:strand:- start:158 stop:634 length:477 start_codon:yes stop_codon:yes gene_type:complete